MCLIFLALIFYNLAYFGKAACPDGTIESITDKTRCFSFHSEKKGFLSAEEICIKNGGHLTSVESMFENVFISQEAMEKFTDSISDDFWIGANRLQTPGIWGWIDGSAFTFTDWDKGQPQNVTGADCGAVKIQSGLWSAKDCFEQKTFVCLIKSAPPLSQKCPDGWSFYPITGFCYKSYTRDSRWGDAEDFCFTQGGHSIHSIDENNFVTNLIPFDPNDPNCDKNTRAWIGSFTVTKQVNWRWTDNTLFNFSVWASGRPYCPNNHYCGVLWNGPRCGAQLETWADADCYAIASYFVCKRPPT